MLGTRVSGVWFRVYRVSRGCCTDMWGSGEIGLQDNQGAAGPLPQSKWVCRQGNLKTWGLECRVWGLGSHERQEP